jgi:hypothetical protein
MALTTDVTRVLKLVETGSLAVDEVLRAALRQGEDFHEWLARQEKATARRPASGLHLRRYKTVPVNVARAAVRRVRKLYQNRPDVISVHWGLRRRNTRPTNERCVVVYVKRKIRREALPPGAVLPEFLELTVRGRRYRIKIDIQAAGAPGLLHTTVSPGNQAEVSVTGSPLFGTLGGLLQLPGGLHAILSGHVARQQGVSVTATALDGTVVDLGTVRDLVLDPRGDGALAGPVAATGADLLVSLPAEVRDPDESDVGFQVFVQVLRDFEPHASWIEDVGLTSDMTFPGGTVTLENLVAIAPQVTVPGDSGAPVLDHQRQLLGFVVGARNNKTYFVTARRVLDVLT